MAIDTAIAWTNHTFNIAWGCAKVSEGCRSCYAETLSTRYGQTNWGPNGTRRTFGDKHWNEPLKWNRQAELEGQVRRVFCSSMCDIFEKHPVIQGELKKLWPLIRRTPHLDWQLLTKRPERIVRSLPSDWGAGGYPNVWLGTSIESNKYVGRAEKLRAVPARVRFISYEPALGPIDQLDLADLHWVIVGGESGPGYREMDHAWARDLRDRCVKKKVAFFFKQSAAYRTELGTSLIELDGSRTIWQQYPGARVPPTIQPATQNAKTKKTAANSDRQPSLLEE